MYTCLGNMFTLVALSYIVDPYPHAVDRRSSVGIVRCTSYNIWHHVKQYIIHL